MNESLLKQAEKRFKTGAIFSNVNLGFGCQYKKVINPSYRDNNSSISLKINDEILWHSVYWKETKQWAVIHNEEKIYELWT